MDLLSPILGADVGELRVFHRGLLLLGDGASVVHARAIAVVSNTGLGPDFTHPP